MNFQSEIETLIRARYPILYVISSEEMRVQNLVLDIARKRQKKTFEWSYSTGIVPAGTSIQSQKHRNAATKDPLMALDQVIEQVEPAIFFRKADPLDETKGLTAAQVDRLRLTSGAIIAAG
jgi:hypothetical protein